MQERRLGWVDFSKLRKWDLMNDGVKPFVSEGPVFSPQEVRIVIINTLFKRAARRIGRKDGL